MIFIYIQKSRSRSEQTKGRKKGKAYISTETQKKIESNIKQLKTSKRKYNKKEYSIIYNYEKCFNNPMLLRWLK